MDNTKKQTLKVDLEVTGRNYLKGQLINSFEAHALIIKESVNRLHPNDEDTITILASDCGTPILEAEYQSKSIGEGEIKTNIELDLKGKALEPSRGVLLDSMSANTKLNKADAGRSTDLALEDSLKLTAKKTCDSNCASANAHYTSKITELVK